MSTKSCRPRVGTSSQSSSLYVQVQKASKSTHRTFKRRWKKLRFKLSARLWTSQYNRAASHQNSSFKRIDISRLDLSYAVLILKLTTSLQRKNTGLFCIRSASKQTHTRKRSGKTGSSTNLKRLSPKKKECLRARRDLSLTLVASPGKHVW